MFNTDDFSKRKITWARLMRLSPKDLDAFPRFCLVPEDFYTVDSLCFFTGQKLEQLIQVLNSEYAAYYFFNNVATLDNGGFQMRQQYVEQIRLPLCISEDVFSAFGFSEDEINYIRGVIRTRKNEIAKELK
jgi:hypothetical protein